MGGPASCYKGAESCWLAVAAVHRFGVDRESERGGRVAHLVHHVGRGLAKREQQRGIRAAQRMWRETPWQQREISPTQSHVGVVD